MYKALLAFRFCANKRMLGNFWSPLTQGQVRDKSLYHLMDFRMSNFFLRNSLLTINGIYVKFWPSRWVGSTKQATTTIIVTVAHNPSVNVPVGLRHSVDNSGSNAINSGNVSGSISVCPWPWHTTCYIMVVISIIITPDLVIIELSVRW